MNERKKKTAYHQHNFMHTRILVILLTIHSFHATNCRLTYSNELKIIYYFGKGYHMTRTKEYTRNMFLLTNSEFCFFFFIYVSISSYGLLLYLSTSFIVFFYIQDFNFINIRRKT